MQNRGAIRAIAISLALICLYYMSFTWVTNGVREDAAEFAQGDPKKEIEYLDSVSSKVVYDFLWIRGYTYQECLEKEINLGLDLKGGMNVTLEVSVVDLIKAMSNHSADPTFNKAVALAKQQQKNSQKDFVTLFGEAFKEVDANARLSLIFNTMELRDKIGYNSSNEEVLKVIRKETESAIENSFNILRTRIDHFGVAQPNIQRLETAGRVLVELPGIKDPERVRKLLQGTANLEFWETYDNREVFAFLDKANNKLKDLVAVKSTKKKDEAKTEATTKKEEDGKDDLVNKLSKDTTKNQTQTKSMEEFAKDNPLFAVLRPNIDKNNQLLEGAAVGISHFKDTAKVNAFLKRKQIKDLFPRDVKFLWGVKSPKWDKSKSYYELVAIKITSRDGKPALGGDVVTQARADFEQNQGSAEVSMTMNGEGARVWARLTKENIGKQVAIVLDNYVYSFPRVNNEIKGGRSQITGNFTITEAKDLANILKSGKLPAPARIIEEAIVGPSLGEKSINSGLMSFGIAFLVVLVYMVFYYKTAGWVANVALLANVFFIVGVLASIGAVLTLPGIAGIILTIGMSVDANVLIYERIREELKLNKGLKLAIKDGYSNAYSAIIDANLTTLFTGIILFIFGHGPIKGFATTLIIGIITSLFAAIFITRLVFISLLDKNKEISFATKLTDNAFKNTKIDFIGKRKQFYVISGLVILLGIGSLFVKGLNQGVDFKGGRTYVVKFDEAVNTTDVRAALKTVYEQSPEVKTFGADNQVKVTTKYKIEEEGADIDKEVEQKLYHGLKSGNMLAKNVTFEKFISDYRMSSQKVGPTIADDIKTSAVYAIIFSLLIIFLYILFRFKNWQYGLGAVAALTHDVLIVLGLFSVFYGILPFSLEIDQAFIAAILTVVGYSINDTVVVFDRIREHLGLKKTNDKAELYNGALNSTLSRTFSTSLSTFVVLLTIFIFGGEVIRGFVFALMVGVVVGTYSSLFIATPVVYDTIKHIENKVDNIKEKRKMKRKKTTKQVTA